MSDEETTPLAKVLDLTTRMFQDIRGDLSGLKVDLTKVQADVTRVQADVTRVQADVTRVQADVTQVQSDMATFQVDVNRRFEAGERRARAFEDLLTLAMSGMRVDVMQVNERLQRLESAAAKAGLL